MAGLASRRGRIAMAVALAAIAGALLVVLAGGSSGPHTSDTVQVDALWFGEAPDGSIRSGVTPVEITAGLDDPRTPLALDLQGLRVAGAGPMWTAATAVAGVQAVLITGVDPRLGQLKYTLREAIDGPSAGALLSVGSIAALRGAEVSSSTTMTGTVLPDGSVGPVSGVAEKLRAAAAAGYSRVLVPRGPAYDPRTGAAIDLEALGRSLGVTVTPVESVPEAYALIADPAALTVASRPPPLDPGLLRMLARRSRGLLASTEARAGASPRIATWRRAAQHALRSGDPVLAFSAAAEAAQAQAAQRAAASARRRAAGRDRSLAERVARVARASQQTEAQIRAQVRATAELPVTRVAQLSALPDVLAWGSFALTAVNVAQRRLRTARSEAELEEIVRFVAVAEFEARTYMSATAESLRFLGTKRIADVPRVVGLLDAYTELITYAAQANRAYADSVRLSAGEDSYLGQLIEESHALRRAVAPELRGLQGPTAEPALRMAVALLEYVETTQLVNDLTARHVTPSEGPPNLAPIKDPATVRTQARSAGEIAAAQVGQIAAAGLDPGYVQWNSRWGADLSLGRLPGTTGEQTLHGLEYQWFAILQSRLLIALSAVS